MLASYKLQIIPLLLILAMLMLLLLSAVPALASQSLKLEPLTIELNGNIVPTPKDTDITEGQVMLPLRWAAEQLGARSIQWDGENRNVTIQTSPDLHNLQKLSSYVNGLTLRSAEREAEIWPIPESVKDLEFPRIRDRQLVLNLETDSLGPGKPELSANPFRFPITITLITNDDIDDNNNNETNPASYMVYSSENHNDRVFLPMDWLEELFYAEISYDGVLNRLSIKARDRQTVEQQITAIEDRLVPASPEEAVKLWGRGEQTRSGALQYAALSPALQQQADKRIRETGWVTGYSSPRVGPVTIKEEKVVSDRTVEYTVAFLELTSDPHAPIATEKMVVEKLALGSRGGWYITKMPLSSGYGVIAGTNQSAFISLPDVQLFLSLPADWQLEKDGQALNISLEDNQSQIIGRIEQLGGYFLPNHSMTISDEKIAGSFGEGHLLVLTRSAPAAASEPGLAEWQEVHAMLPYKERVWVDLSVSVSPENDAPELKRIFGTAMQGVVFYIPE